MKKPDSPDHPFSTHAVGDLLDHLVDQRRKDDLSIFHSSSAPGEIETLQEAARRAHAGDAYGLIGVVSENRIIGHELANWLITIARGGLTSPPKGLHLPTLESIRSTEDSTSLSMEAHIARTRRALADRNYVGVMGMDPRTECVAVDLELSQGRSVRVVFGQSPSQCHRACVTGPSPDVFIVETIVSRDGWNTGSNDD